MKRFIFLYTSICAVLYSLTATEVPIKDISDSRHDPQKDSLYLVVDLAGGTNATSYPIRYLSAVPEGGWTTNDKTTKLVLRRIEAGSFMKGSRTNELGRWDEFETLHQVTLTKPYYIGVFEMTQKQWSLVMGNDPSSHNGDARPVEKVSYGTIRGAVVGTKWPTSAEVDTTSFMGTLRAKTSLDFDLPTGAQWEYACRAGTTTGLNSGRNLADAIICSNMNKVGRYAYNGSDAKGGYSSNHTTVGSYLPNAWGLYDMHGNVHEWCLDWWKNSLGTRAVTDPVGYRSGQYRLICGGSWSRDALFCRSAFRNRYDPSCSSGDIGLRVVARDVMP